MKAVRALNQIHFPWKWTELHLNRLMLVGLILAWFTSTSADLKAQSESEGDSNLLIRDICRVKGQEENTLMGLGLVVGLKGTGDGNSLPTARALARVMQKTGGQVSIDMKGILNTQELKDAKNVASVIVTARVPAGGAQQGDKVDCTVSAISAKSLEGGILISTPLFGPRVDQPVVYALAQGPIDIHDPKIPTSAKISGGCKLEATIQNEFALGDVMTLVIDPSHASFSAAQYVADVININHSQTWSSPGGNSQGAGSGSSGGRSAGEKIAQAKDQLHVEVKIPSGYREQHVGFAALILELPLVNLQPQKRVTIQEREGVVIIGEDVTIAPVAITHKGLRIDTKGSTTNGFVGLPGESPANQRPKLKSLVDSLNLLAVPTEDVISIIKALKRQGNLYGELVIE